MVSHSICETFSYDFSDPPQFTQNQDWNCILVSILTSFLSVGHTVYFNILDLTTSQPPSPSMDRQAELYTLLRFLLFYSKPVEDSMCSKVHPRNEPAG